ncbi:DUF6701 domain-containing protein [Glaciecola sp. 1036]|uniref:DUF6701 domain-containing protein n=1 Tax=Alteromonadaceae TaxID=72275 RepID=UPI003D07274F
MVLNRIIAFVVLCCMSSGVLASVCSAVFPDATSSFTNSGGIRFYQNAQIIGNDAYIDIPILQDDSYQSCNTASCSYSGSQSDSLVLVNGFFYTNSSQDWYVPSNEHRYLYQGSSDNVHVYQNGTLYYYYNNVISRIDELIVDTNSSVVFDAGVYWINYLQMAQNATLRVNGNDKVILYVNSSSLANNLRFNWDGDPDQLVIISYGDFSPLGNSFMKGYLYSLATVNWGSDGIYQGAINAQNIIIGQNGDFYFDASGIATADFDGTCVTSTAMPDPVLYYSMDMCDIPSNFVNDDIGANNASVNGYIGVGYQGPYCQNATFDGGTNYLDVPDSSLFNLSEGSVSVWVNVPDIDYENAPSAGRMTVLSKDLYNSNSGGILNIWIDDFGAVRANHANSSTSVTVNTTSGLINENQWHHIVYTFGSDGARLYVDGNLKATYLSFTSGLTSNGTPMAIGANTWLYNAASYDPRSTQLRDFFKGSIDEVKIYNTQLNATQVSQLHNEQPQTCTDCSSDPVLVSHWSADVCSFDQSALLDVQSGHNGIIRQGISNVFSSRMCQGLSFDGNQSYATIAHNDDFKIANGAISMWAKISDLSHSNNSSVGGNALFSKDRLNFGDGGHLYLVVDASGQIAVRHQSTTDSVFMTTSPVIEEGKWHHIVYSFGANGTQIYVDGILVLNNASHTNGLFSNSDDIVLGATSKYRQLGAYDPAQYGDFLLGEMDEVKIYRNQPTAQDVSSWYTASPPDSCTTCNSLVAQYSFEDTTVSGSTINDIAGNGYSGTLANSLEVNKPFDNVYCSAVTSDANLTVADKVYFDTGVQVEELGEQGAISFWYRHNDIWNDGQRRMLFDGSNSGNSKYFFMSKLENGGLAFGLEDVNDLDVQITTSSNSFAADEWVHIGVNWNMLTKTYTIYLNGQPSSSVVLDSANITTLPTLGNIVFGDNKTDYVVNYMSYNGANGLFDDIRMYSQAVSQAQFQADLQEATPCSAVHHYALEHPDTAITCGNPTVTVKACANADCSELSSDPTSITLTPTTAWVTPTFTFTGSTQVELQNRTAGTLTIGSSSQTPIAPIECSNNCEVEYENAGLEFFHVDTGANEFSTTPFIGEASLNKIGLRALGSNGATCDALTNGTESINISYQCISTVDEPYSPNTCSQSFAGITVGSGSTHSGNLSMSFDAAGETNFAGYSYADVGLVQVSASATIDGATLQPTTTLFKFIPASLDVSSDATNLMPAGQVFNLQIQAIGANGGVLPGYSANELQASALRTLPSDSGAADASFYLQQGDQVQTSISINYSGIGPLTFTNGIFTSSTAYLEETGSYTLSLRDNNYLGSVISSNALSTGRFIPAYFEVVMQQQPSFTPSCSDSFTYVGQNFGFAPTAEPVFLVTAYNTKARITQNYGGTEWRLSPNQTSVNNAFNYLDTSTYSGALIVNNAGVGPTLSDINDYDGDGTISLSDAQFSYQKIANPQGLDGSPFEANVQLVVDKSFFTDTDGVCYMTSYPGSCEDFTLNDITGTSMRYGRLMLENTYGPENQNLRIPLSAQYLDSGQWRTSQSDSCTDINLSTSNGDILLVHDSQSPVDISQEIASLSATGTLVAGLSDDADMVLSPVIVNGEPVAGALFVQLQPRNVANHWSEFLNIDWDQDGDIDSDDTPTAAVSFGLYRGNDKTIHWREVF